ncbi:FRG domain-containing protein [Bacteroides reticulotermitis]|uniref:FRG domain-containing protein n=1 Tax=Bacteroides reticulotermitis TaxID=1133319 RepID=UPI003A8C7AE0
MSIKHVVIVNSLTEFLKTIHKTQYLKYIWYRGQRYSEFQLEPSRFRDKVEISNNDKYIKNTQYIVKNDMLALREFKRAYKKLCGDKKYHDVYYLYLMQHYGIPTRLLDFSLNPLVALYFSVKEENDINIQREEYELSGTMSDFNKESSSVYCIDPSYVNHYSFNTDDIIDLSLYKFSSLNNLDHPICIKPQESLIDERLIRQNGVFVCFGRMIHPLDYYAIDEKNMLKIIIPNSKRVAIKKQLKKEFGIDDAFLFPDFNNTNEIIPSIIKKMEIRHNANIERIKDIK